jgi:hypothetical protein
MSMHFIKGGQMTVQHLRDLQAVGRYATIFL